MTVRELIDKLQALDPEVEVLMRTVTGSDYETDWEPISEVESVQEETVWVSRDERFGYHRVPCVRLYE